MRPPPSAPAAPPQPPAFLAGGGEMGARIRAHPWHATALGPAARWPAVLRTTVRLMLSTNHPMFLFWGPQHLCLYNDAYSRSLGPEKHPAMLGRPGREAWDEIWPVIGPQIEQVMAGLGATWHENQLLPITRHGALAPVYWTYSYSPVDDETAPHGVGGALVLVTETTAQVLAAERSLAEKNRWLRLFDQAPGFICVLQGAGHVFAYANARYQALVGQRAVVGQDVRQCLPEVARQGFITLLDQVYGSGEPFVAHSQPIELAEAGESALRTRYLDFIYQPIREADGSVSGIFVEGHDVTERTLATQRARERAQALEAANTELQQVQAELQQRARELRSLADNTPDILVRFDRAQRHLFVNAAITRATGKTPEEIIGRTNAELDMPPELNALWSARLEAVFASGQASDFGFSFPSPDGLRSYQSRLVPEFALGADGARGPVERVLSIVQDVTEQRRAEGALRDAERRKDEFLATLAHELRNPLAPLRTGLQVLERSPDGSTAQGVRTMMRRQLEHMVRLVDDLLDISRISAGKMTLHREPVTLQMVADVALEASRPALLAGRHQLRQERPAQPVWVCADLTRLAQVLGNLLNNAAKYTPEAGTVTLRIDSVQGMALLQVQDTGLGIPPDMLDEVFQMFTQVNSTLHRAQGGLGIGLALARRVMELHGGSIEAHSAGVGRGSLFSVRLPLLQQAPDAPAAAALPGAATNPATHAPAGGLRVLVVDDNRDAADSLAMLLGLWGHTVQSAYGGAQGLQLLQDWQPQAAFIDIGMPGMNGIDLARAARRHGSHALLVALTGWGTEGDAQRSRDAGFDLHLTKPVAADAVAQVLAGLST